MKAIWKTEGGDWEITQRTKSVLIQWRVNPEGWEISFWKRRGKSWEIQEVPGRKSYSYTEAGLRAAKQRAEKWLQQSPLRKTDKKATTKTA